MEIFIFCLRICIRIANMQLKYNFRFRAGGAGPTSPTLVGPKIFIFMVKTLYFQSSGRTNNCQIEVLFKWSDQSCTPSAAPALKNTTIGSSKNSNNNTVLFRWYRTTHFKAIGGLKQGYSLSPLLANIYLSDLHDHIK